LTAAGFLPFGADLVALVSFLSPFGADLEVAAAFLPFG